MMFWTIANSAFSALVAASIATVLLMFGHRMILAERVGFGVFGGAVVLNIAPILRNGGVFMSCLEPTPFDSWGSALMRAGILIFIAGRGYRFWRHERRNKANAAVIATHLAANRRGDSR